jgi:hypothetical protein
MSNGVGPRADYAPSEREAEWVEEAFRPAIPAIETARAR